MKTPPKRGRGQPRKEATTQIRIYSADKPRLKGKTQAEAVRRLVDTSKWNDSMKPYEASIKPIGDDAVKEIADAYRQANQPPSVTVIQMDNDEIEGFASPPECGVEVWLDGAVRSLRAKVRVRLRNMPIGPCMAVFSGMPTVRVSGFDDALNGGWIVEELKPDTSLTGPAFVFTAKIRKVPTMEMFLAAEREENMAKRARKLRGETHHD